MEKVRNFCIIAHIDHGKSTLADRFLELTKTVEKRKMKEQLLDQMDLERERGITIKLQPVRMEYRGYVLNLIDTPGHVDFSYEVSRSLAAVEGAILLVDATQGIQAQTLGNLYLALEQNLTIIPVINKIDLPAADVAKVREEIISLLGCPAEDILLASGKTGEGVADILSAVIKRVPAPQPLSGDFRALVFDSLYNEYKGVIAYVRVKAGEVKKGDKVNMLATGSEGEVLELGVFRPDFQPVECLRAGEIGYLTAGFKEVSECRVGDTVAFNAAAAPLPGYKEVKPMIFSGIFCREGDDYNKLRQALEKLKLNDAALFYEPENSPALGYGFRCGFLGMLHLDIVQERLRREFGLDLLVTVPSVKYKIKRKGKEKEEEINSPQELPDPSQLEYVKEPIMALDIVTPQKYLGALMQLAQEKRGIYKNTEYLDEQRAILHYEIPLVSLLVDFYDKLKSLSAGYASLNYEFLAFRETEVRKLDIYIAEEKIEALSVLVYQDDLYRVGKQIVRALKESIPRQLFMVKIQAAVNGKIIASERLSALRKDVTAKLYGGDVSRKKKLLEKQKKGKKKMMSLGKGKINLPPDAFLAILKR